MPDVRRAAIGSLRGVELANKAEKQSIKLGLRLALGRDEFSAAVRVDELRPIGGAIPNRFAKKMNLDTRSVRLDASELGL